MFRPTCRPSSSVADKITSHGSVTDYPSVDPPSRDIYGIKVLTANAVGIKEVYLTGSTLRLHKVKLSP
jgi:hypothetical protein